MTQRRAPKRNLSKGILEMKFMKKSKEKADQDKQYEESQELFSSNVIERMKVEGNQFVIEPSMVSIDGLISGRLSFKGMNPDIERLMELENQEVLEREKCLDRQKSNRPEISDEEMATHLGAAIRHKFISKKEKGQNKATSGSSSSSDGPESGDDVESAPPSKKPQFVKPVDSD